MNTVMWCLTILYPFLVYGGFRLGYRAETTVMIGVLVALKVYLGVAGHCSRWGRLIVSLSVCSCLVTVSLMQHTVPLLVPAAINIGLCGTFLFSLVYPPNVIERIARRMDANLPQQGVMYCRRVCWIWVVFFVLNTGISLDSISRSLEWWSVYNGLISYLLIGALCGVEYLFRQRVMKRAYPRALGSTSRAVVLLLLVLSGVSEAFADNMRIEQIRSRLTPSAPFRVEFTEERRVRVLSAPLQSRGEMMCVPGAGIVRRIDKPIVMTDLITPRGVLRIDQRQHRSPSIDRAGISATLLSLMSGDIERAQENFTIATYGTEAQWTVVLTPQDSLVAQLIRTISISGRHHPESIEVQHADGDVLRTSFGPPVPLSADETAQVKESLHAAF